MACGGQGGLPNQGGLPPAQQAQQAPPKMLEAVPTVCLRMTNMLNEEMLKDDEEYAEIKEDIAEELQNYGTVAGVEIPRSGVGYLCAFVKFCEPSNPSAELCLWQPVDKNRLWFLQRRWTRRRRQRRWWRSEPSTASKSAPSTSSRTSSTPSSSALCDQEDG